MLATKKHARAFRVLGLAAAAVLWGAGCTPAGPRALLKGERLIREGKHEAAVAKLEEATRLLPREARAWNFLGLAYQGSDRFADAIRAYQEALALDHNLAAVHYNLGCLYLERGDLEAAIDALTTFTGLQPQSDLGWLRLGMASLRAGQLEAAERSFKRALQINHRLAEALNGLGLVRVQGRKYAEGYLQFDAALRMQSNYPPALLNSAIVAHQYLNDRASALRRYQLYVALKPQPPNSEAVDRIVRQLDADLHPTARVGEADSGAHLATPTRPAEPEGRSAKREPKTEGRPPSPKPPSPGTTLASAGHPNSASGGSSVASPPPAHPKTSAADVAKTQPLVPTRPTEATSKPEFTSKPEAAPPVVPAPVGNPPRTPVTAVAAPPVVAGDPAAPRYHYESPAVAKAGDRAEASRMVLEGLRLQERYQVKEAMAKYREAIQADPASFDAYYNLGVAALDAAELPQALTAYEHALAVDANSRKARFNFAIALERAGYARDAAQELERLVAAHPTEARAQFNLAHLYADKLNDPQRAKAAYQRVLELDPQHPQATAIRYWLEAHP